MALSRLRGRVGWGCFFSLVFSAITSVAYSADPTPQQRLDSVQHDLDAARQDSQTLNAQARGLQADIVRLQGIEVIAAKNLQDAEADMTTIEAELDRLQADETRQSTDLATRQRHEIAMLAALERVATTPPALITVAPGSPIDVARSGILLGAAVPALQSEIQAIAAGMAQLHQTESEIDKRHTASLHQRQILEDQQKHLTDLVQQKQSLQGAAAGKASSAQQRATQLVAQAADLKQAIERLDRAREETAREDRAEVDRVREERAKATQAAALHPSTPSVPAGPGPAGGHLVTPASGDVIKRFGEPDGAATAKGISYSTRNSGQIVAPAPGTVLFAGPFKGYGQILIIDHGGDYHSLLAGLGKIECAVGQKVTGGEPVGLMPADGTPVLYFEVRRQNQPVDPLPWLAARSQKASG